MDKNGFEQLIEFMTNVREKSEIRTWWIGSLDEDTEEPETISLALRGWFKDGYWQPTSSEEASCCEPIQERLENGDLEEEDAAFALMDHCATEEHIRNMLSNRTDEQLDNEYQHMLNQTLNTLTNAFEEEE